MKQTTLRQRVMDLVSLAKPRISGLTLVTTFTGMYMAGLAGTGIPPVSTMVLTLLGTALGVTSSCMINNYVDRELDRNMSRTEDRPLPDQRLTPEPVLETGVLFGVFGVLLLSTVSLTAATLLAISIVNYALVYTIWMKRTSPYSTELVGLSGALAPVIGWTAVTGRVDATAVGLMAILFFWQPAHFWTLGILHMDDYRNANLPRYPVVHGREKTKLRMVCYNILLIGACLSLVLFSSLHLFYGTTVLLTGGTYVYFTTNYDPTEEERSKHLFLFFSSIGFLLTLLIAIYLDLLLV